MMIPKNSLFTQSDIIRKFVIFSFLFVLSCAVSYLIVQDKSKSAFAIMLTPLLFLLYEVLTLKRSIYLLTVLIFFPVYLQFLGRDAIDTASLAISVLFCFHILRKIVNKQLLLANKSFLFVFSILLFCGIVSTMNVLDPIFLGKSFRALVFLTASILLFLLIMQIDFKDEIDKTKFIHNIMELIIVLMAIQIFIGTLIYYIPDTGRLFKIFLTREKTGIEFEAIKNVVRFRSIILNPEITGEIVAVLMPFGLYSLFNENKKRYIFYIVVLTLGLIFSVTRSGLILYFASILLYFIYFNVGFAKKFKLLLIILSIASFFIFLFPSLLDPFFIRLKETSRLMQEGADFTRIINRHSTFTGGLSYLGSTLSFLGNGLVSPSVYRVFELHFHNLFFTIIFQYGILGAIFYFYFFIKIFIKLFKTSFKETSEYRYLYMSLFFSYCIFIINEMKFEFNREAPYHLLCWLLFSLYFLSTKRIVNHHKGEKL